MKSSRKALSSWRRVRHASLCGAALAFIVPACTDDSVVYPNRSLRAQSGEAGALAAAGERGGGAAGIGGASAGADAGGDTSMSGASGAAGADNGPRCGDGIVQPPEQCDDGNTKSGDGCSSTCQSSCEKCEKNLCVAPLTLYLDSVQHPDSTADATNHDPYDLCYKGTGTINRGPGAGESRNAACRFLVDCIHQTDCSQTKGPSFIIKRCLCNHDFTNPPGALGAEPQCRTAQDPNDPDPFHPQNPNGFIPGACYDEYQQASETDTPAQALNSGTATGSAAGAALWLVQGCDARVCPEECVPTYFEHGVAATITADLDTAQNDAGESPVGDLVADAQRTIAQADIALVGNYFFTASVETKLAYEATPYRDADAPGRVLWSEARALVISYAENSLVGRLDAPALNDTLFKVSFTGKQISDALERQLDPATGGRLQVSGLGYTWDASKPVGSRLVEVHLANGTPVDKSASYSVAVCTTLVQSTSPYTSLHAGTPAAVPNVDLNELLGEYLSQLPQPVSPPTLDRITRIGG